MDLTVNLNSAVLKTFHSFVKYREAYVVRVCFCFKIPAMGQIVKFAVGGILLKCKDSLRRVHKIIP